MIIYPLEIFQDDDGSIVILQGEISIVISKEELQIVIDELKKLN